MKSWIAEAANRDEWLAQHIEETIAPEMEIVDPHHHLWLDCGLIQGLGTMSCKRFL